MTEVRNEPVDPRILFAAERTFLAYLRTGLALMGFGFVVARFGFFLRQIAAPDATQNAPKGISVFLGIALTLLGVVVCAGAAPWYGRTIRRLQTGAGYEPPRYGLAFWVAGSVAVTGVLMVVYLLLLR